MIVHLAGAPAAGKSTFARALKGWKIYDIDRINDGFVRGFTGTAAEFRQRYAVELQRLYDALFEQAARHRRAVFVGLNYPDPRVRFRGRELHVAPFRIRLPAKTVRRVYLDTPVDTIVRNRTRRERRLGHKFTTRDVESWRRDARWWRREFTRLGYRIVDPEHVAAYFTHLLTKK